MAPRAVAVRGSASPQGRQRSCSVAVAAGWCWCQLWQLAAGSLVSARRLWKDLQTFCCSQGKCNFHDNSNLNCTLKVGEPEPRACAPLQCL